ncbi:MAG: S41 family peptidase [Anaerolineales bacterium]
MASPYVEAYVAGHTMPLRPFGEVWVYLEQEFYGELPPPEERVRGAIRGMLALTGDPYTILLDPVPAQAESVRLSGREGNIGVTLWETPAGALAIDPYPDGPAARAGIREGDHLLKIDELDLVAVESDGGLFTPFALARDALRGEPGREVTLTLLRPPTLVFTTTVVREEVRRPSIEWRMVTAEIGYLDLDIFTHETANEMEEALVDLQDKGLEALILDLRSNGGGVVAPVPRIAGHFLGAGETIYFETRESQEERVTTDEGEVAVAFEGPLVILVDGGTASAAEMVAASLAEHGRATLVGRHTYGKTSIQVLYPLQDGSVLHVTHAVWLTPQRNRLDGIGIEPDLVVEYQADRDADLQRALAYLEELLAR